MAKFKPGETSQRVLNKKREITKSIQLKAKLLNEYNDWKNIPSCLNNNGHSISQDAVHKWNDNDLDIISYSRNSAHSEHNQQALNALLKSLKSLNKRLLEQETSRKKTTALTPSNSYEVAINELKNDNAELINALAEVYRAYMQIIEQFKEDKVIDDSYRKLIQDQARVLGRNRLSEVKQ